MKCTILASVAILAALVLPVSASASDRELARLSIVHVKASTSVHECVGRIACAYAITRSVKSMTAITKRATTRLKSSGSRRAVCLKAVRAYMAAGRASTRAAQSFILADGTTRTRDAYYYAAASVDRTLLALVRGC